MGGFYFILELLLYLTSLSFSFLLESYLKTLGSLLLHVLLLIGAWMMGKTPNRAL